MKLTKYIRDAGYDLIEGPVRNHKPLQLWLKTTFDEAELYYGEINHAFNSSVQLTITEDLALSIDITKSDEYGFNIGVSLLEEILNSLGLGNFELSAKVKSGKKVTISYDNSVTKIIPLGEITNYLSTADFRHPNPVLLKNANRNNILVITGVVFAQNLVVEIETDFNIDANLVATLNQAAGGKLEFAANSQQKLKMVSSGTNFFPIAIKANRIDFDKGVFKGLTLVTDNRNFF
ncbi:MULTISPECIES: hypothetical protein [Flavobacterium]|uniref:gasdermin n=1 Tax=Flavobacterium TaxID=237 RepID=UPI001FCB5381|nr:MULTISPECIES: hypothetical protein [Flavobacterium]UOK41703.1 hypothetical protein LZF87_10315 [Flavobacterium enshiense]